MSLESWKVDLGRRLAAEGRFDSAFERVTNGCDEIKEGLWVYEPVLEQIKRHYPELDDEARLDFFDEFANDIAEEADTDAELFELERSEARVFLQLRKEHREFLASMADDFRQCRYCNRWYFHNEGKTYAAGDESIDVCEGCM